MLKKAGKRFPNYQPWDYSIDFIEGKTSLWGPLYAISEKELNILKP